MVYLAKEIYHKTHRHCEGNAPPEIFPKTLFHSILQNMHITGIIFDMDGTLLDSMGLWLNAGVYYLESLNIVPEPGLGETLMEMNMAQGAEYIRQHYRLNLTIPEICTGINNTLKTWYAEKIQLKDCVLEFLKLLKEKHIPAVIATNTDRELFTPCLARLGITEYFDAILTCSEYNTSKNLPDIFFAAADKIKSAPSTTLVFEDALYALRTAKKAGFPTVGIYDQFTQAYTSPQKIMHHSTYYCQSYKDAERLIEKNQSVTQ